MIKLFRNSIKEIKQCLAYSKCLVSVRPLLTFLVSFLAVILNQPNQTAHKFQMCTMLVHYSVSLSVIYPLPWMNITLPEHCPPNENFPD